MSVKTEHQNLPTLLIVLGNQLFPLEYLPKDREVQVFLAEDEGLCTYVRHHQQKIVLFLSAMRAYADELKTAGYQVHYHALIEGDKRSYEEKLSDILMKTKLQSLMHFEIEDKAVEKRIIEFADKQSLPRAQISSPMFLCTRKAFTEFAQSKKRLLMADFYTQQRQRLNILLEDDGEPCGGRWSFDADNRKKLPKNLTPPDISWAKQTKHDHDVIALVEERFADHPGRAAEFCWPSTRAQALSWLNDFVKQRLELFGPYEDALTTLSPTVFHSALTPVMNLGLLTPAEIVRTVLEYSDRVPMQSLEGFIRQVIGWREFVRGVYQNYSERQDGENFWQHERQFTQDWYNGTTGIPPLDDTINTAQRLGWTHHIPRLMVLGNLMTLCEIHPSTAHRWFMEMYVDSSEWVMGPNVYGMGLFSDGGIFATKPYICGSNYLLKMSNYKKGAWCDTVDGLYWRFIDKHRDFFAGNPRLALMPKALDRLKDERREKIFDAAEQFLQEFTQ